MWNDIARSQARVTGYAFVALVLTLPHAAGACPDGQITGASATVVSPAVAGDDGVVRFHVVTDPRPPGAGAATIERVVAPSGGDDGEVIWSIGHRVVIQGSLSPAGPSARPYGVLRVGPPRDIASADARAVRPRFPVNNPGRRWHRFTAEGFPDDTACGVIYRSADTVTNGMPLGGIDTGCVDLETSGLLGYSTIFNTHVPRRRPLNVPLLGLSVGGTTWLLCDPRPRDGSGGYQPSASGVPATVWRNGRYEQVNGPFTPCPMTLRTDGLKTAREVHYWGHYPIADLEFETDAPVGVGVRAWSPFFPGDEVDSMLPAIVFEVRLRSGAPERHPGTIAFSFPGPLDQEAGSHEFRREEVNGALRGVKVSAPLASYLVGVIGPDAPRLGGGRFRTRPGRGPRRPVRGDLVRPRVERRRIQLGRPREPVHSDVHPVLAGCTRRRGDPRHEPRGFPPADPHVATGHLHRGVAAGLAPRLARQ